MTIRSLIIYGLFLLAGIIPRNTHAQWGYSPLVDSLAGQVTDSTVSLLVRQLSGDTTVVIGGLTDSILSRHSSHADNSKAAQFILEKFQSYGLNARIQQYDANGQNVIATIPGQVFPNKQFSICGHYDSQPSGALAPGADDNASGTAAVLEAARVLSDQSFDVTLKFIAFDEEEQGLIGSKAYADSAFAEGHDIQGVINLDMIAWDSNNDGELSVASNTNSLDLFANYIDIMRLYEPGLSPHLINISASDHASFWNKGWDALLAIEEYPGDFNAYYHTTADVFQHLNIGFFTSMTRAAIAGLATLAWDFRLDLSHQPLESAIYNGCKEVLLTVEQHPGIGSGPFGPTLWHRIDGGAYVGLQPVANDTSEFYFELCNLEPGQQVDYYFAVQDSSGRFVATLPEGGRGLDPPGSLPGSDHYSFFVLNDTVESFCKTGLPLSIPANITTHFALDIPVAARIHDVNVELSLNHTWPRDLNIFLVHPDGTHVELSTANGYNYDNYTNTVFDDEATSFIHQHRSPFTGSYRPEQPLSLLDEKNLAGEWVLKINNSDSYSGTLTEFCLDVSYTDDYYFVDSAVAQSGHGMSRDSAFRTFSEAIAMNPGPGERIFVKPGTYHEDITISSNGELVVPVQTGVSLTGGDTLVFTAPVDLSGVDVANNPGDYYLLVYRSRYSNNGYFPVREADDAADRIVVDGAMFIPEEGVAGDTTKLSASVVRPVFYQKYPNYADSGRVVFDANQDPSVYTILYIGDPIGDGSSDAWPADANFISGFDLTNSLEGGGVHLQSSSYNILSGMKIYETNGAGVYINGNENRPSKYNIVTGNEIFNTPFEGVYIGAGGMPEYNNHAHFNHLTGNEIYTAGTGPLAQLENGIDLKEYNHCNVVEGNLLRDFDLVSSGNSALDIRSGQDHALVYGNTFRDIGKGNAGTSAVVQVYGNSQGISIFNNILYNTQASVDGLYAFRSDGTGHTGSGIYHNTVWNVDNAFLLEDYGADPAFEVRNNIIDANSGWFTNWGTGGRFEVSHNLFTSDPTPNSWMHYYNATGRQIGDPFLINPTIGDMRLTLQSTKAINGSVALSDTLKYDWQGGLRYPDAPDIGAFELPGKIVWTGATGNGWFTPANWSGNQLPGPGNTAVIPSSPNDPVLEGSNANVTGIVILDNAGLTVRAVLEATGRSPENQPVSPSK